jgi:hypothetical protein
VSDTVVLADLSHAVLATHLEPDLPPETLACIPTASANQRSPPEASTTPELEYIGSSSTGSPPVPTNVPSAIDETVTIKEDPNETVNEEDPDEKRRNKTLSLDVRHDRIMTLRHKKMHTATNQLLTVVAKAFPNLVALQFRRRGGYLCDIVEGADDDFVNTFVKPLSTLQKLEYLDLGMAIMGADESQRFPPGCCCSCTPQERPGGG